jgi:hypothetical protein
MWLETWAERRGARFAAAHGILSRADVVLPHPARPLSSSRATCLAVPQITSNIFGTPSAEQTAIIRRTLPGPAAEASIGE